MPKGYVYVLSNPSYPSNLLKIGKTTKTPEQRAKELSSTGVPTPFTVDLWTEVEDCHIVERDIHTTLSEYRKTLRKEFFTITIKLFLEFMRETYPKLQWHTGKLEESLPFKLRKINEESQKLYINLKKEQTFDSLKYEIDIQKPLRNIVENLHYRSEDFLRLEEDDLLIISTLSDIEENIGKYKNKFPLLGQ